MARRVIGIIVAVIGIAAFVFSFVWKNSLVDDFVKYPTNVDETPKYAGTVTIYLDQKTYAPLATPVVAPLTVSRHIQAIGSESSSSLVVVQETIDLDAPGVFKGTQKNQYVMDRKLAVNVQDDRAWAFSPDNKVDRAGAYRLAFPFDTPVQDFTIFKNEVGTTYTASPAGEATVEGLAVKSWAADQSKPLPVTPAYLAFLNTLTPLPNELTLDQLKPTLKQYGLDVDAVLPALAAKLQPADVATLLGLSTKPIKLNYVESFKGQDFVEPSTGAIVEVKGVEETVLATPDPAALPALAAIFDKYPDVPEAVTASKALAAVAANPIKVFTNAFSQTPESVKDIAGTVKDKKTQKDFAKSTLPTILLVGGIVLTVLGLALALFRRRKPAAPATPPAEPKVPTPA